MPVAQSASPSSNRIKVAAFCTQDYGGAGLAAYRHHSGLRKIGVDSTLWVLDKKSLDPTVKVLPGKPVAPLWRRWRALMTRFPRRAKDCELFTDTVSDVSLETIPGVTDTDVIHFHWMPGLLNYGSAARAFSGKPVVWTLHDMNPFTGGCHYAMGCGKYREDCGACPQLGSTIEKDLSRGQWSVKRALYGSLDIHVVAPSEWIAVLARESELFRKFPVTVIPNGFPLDVFAPRSKTAARRALKLPHQSKIILFGAQSAQNPRKGFRFLLEALKRFSKLYRKKEILLLTFGRSDAALAEKLPFRTRGLGFVDDEKTMADLYSAVDVQLLPSSADNLPNTVIEALACGTPTVAFASGGMPETIAHKKTGWLAPPGDVQDLVEGIAWAVTAEKRDTLQRRCREAALSHYSDLKQAKRYLRLYRSVVAKERILRPQRRKKINKIVSAIVSVYSAERFIQGCLDDLERQTIADRLEIVVVDTGSQQNEDAVVREYMRRYDNIVHIKTDERETVYGAWNRGIRAARGRYITNANADDRHRKDALEILARALDENPEISLVYGDCRVTRAENDTFENARPTGVFRQPEFSREALFQRCFVGPQPMWRREVHDEHGYFDDSFVVAGDYEFWLRISKTRKFLHVKETLGLYLDSPGSVEHANAVFWRRETLEARERHRGNAARKDAGPKESRMKRKGPGARRKKQSGKREPAKYPKRIGDFEITEIEDGYTIYDPKTDRVQYLNNTAVLILELCTGRNSPARIAELLKRAYSLPQAPEKVVKETLAKLKQESLVR